MAGAIKRGKGQPQYNSEKCMAHLLTIKTAFIIVALMALAGCKDRVIWEDNGAIEKTTENREIWNTNGKMGTEDRPIWVNKDGEKVVK